MKTIFDKITRSVINDLEIIQDIECVKCKDPEFDINFGYYEYDLSLLVDAVDYGREDLVRYLLSDPNINVNHRSKQGNTVLHFCDKVSILKLLLDHKDLDVNIQNSVGWTVLYHVCFSGLKACVKELLLDARIDVLIRDNKGRTARDYALKRGYPGIAKIINNFRYTTLLRIPNKALLHDIVRMIIEEYT